MMVHNLERSPKHNDMDKIQGLLNISLTIFYAPLMPIPFTHLHSSFLMWIWPCAYDCAIYILNVNLSVLL